MCTSSQTGVRNAVGLQNQRTVPGASGICRVSVSTGSGDQGTVPRTRGVCGGNSCAGRIGWLPFLFALGMLMAASGVAWAQEQAQEQEESHEFIVTASRVEEEVLDAPAMVSVITAEEIAASGADNLVQTLETAAGISFRSYSGEAQAEISMRGFGESSFGRVLVLVDGRRLNNLDMQGINWLSIPLADIDRIEVLQGSSSVRHGNSAVGGVVNIITKTARKGIKVQGSLAGGSFSENREQIYASAGDGKSGLTASGSHYATDGYRKRSGLEAMGGSVGGNVDITDTLSIKATAAFTKTDYQMPGSLTAAQFAADPRQALNSADGASENLATGDVVLSWCPSDTIGFQLPVSIVHKNISADMTSWYSYTDRAADSLEARPGITFNSGIGGVKTRLVGGVDVLAARLGVSAFASAARSSETNYFEVSQVTVGPYLATRLDFSDAISLEAGARYDTGVNSAKDKSGSFDKSKAHSVLVYEAGLVGKPAPWAKTFVKYGTLFRYPFTDEQASTYYPPFGFNDSLEAETGYTIEGGAGLRVGKNISSDLVVYCLVMNNEIAYDSSTYTNRNLDATRRIGADIAAKAAIFPFLNVEGSYGYVDAVFTAGSNEGKRIPLVPAHSGKLAFTLNTPFGLEAGPTAEFRSSCYQGGDTANSQTPIPGFAVYGLRALYQFAAGKTRIELTAKVDNIFDLSYAPLVYYSAWSGASAYYPAQGRSFSIGLGFRY